MCAQTMPGDGVIILPRLPEAEKVEQSHTPTATPNLTNHRPAQLPMYFEIRYLHGGLQHVTVGSRPQLPVHRQDF